MIDALEDYLEKCAQVKVKIDLVESLLTPATFEVSLRYVLKHANYGSSSIFQLIDTTEMPNHQPRCKKKTMVGKSGESRCEAGKWDKRLV